MNVVGCVWGGRRGLAMNSNQAKAKMSQTLKRLIMKELK